MAWMLWLLSACTLNPRSQSSVVVTSLPVSNTQKPIAIPLPSDTPSPVPASTATALPTPTQLPTASPTPTETPEPLPVLTSRLLRQGVEPQSYIPDTCRYLERRWSLDGSPPGTVVVPVMFHSVVKSGRVISDPKDISEDQFRDFMQYARYLDFQTITAAQLLDFLQNNAPIPTRSMILILDDRRPGVARDHFMPLLEANNWTLTLAYIADPNSMQWAMTEVERLNESGRLDVQSHGYTGELYIIDQTPVEGIQNEIWNSTPVLEQNFGKRPIAFIWPGGNFSSLAVQVAREGGYQLGFTAYSRGPLLYNWIPLGEAERAVGDPLMVLPRAWSNSMPVNLDEGVKIAAQARQFAVDHYEQEAIYYRTYCHAELPGLDQVLPPTAVP